ncbi:hypothetical protein AVEN_92443-1 [Araneus ventricosus]|uniref:Uncharacterized protein n=1 Tax=Araneus ventricosus TaxID=182803 RepID=A0A4Y2AHC0_ARAVE|nr:hypothetical protein AVEN_92443-1 [Araneus ventricosus]
MPFCLASKMKCKDIVNFTRSCIACQNRKSSAMCTSPPAEFKVPNQRFVHINIDLMRSSSIITRKASYCLTDTTGSPDGLRLCHLLIFGWKQWLKLCIVADFRFGVLEDFHGQRCAIYDDVFHSLAKTF